MDARKFIDSVTLAARLKDTMRHCYTEKGRRESVAEHSWLTTLMAFFLQDEFPQADMNKVITMCMIHDLGEAFTGDIPRKTNGAKKRCFLHGWIPCRRYMRKSCARFTKRWGKEKPSRQRFIKRSTGWRQ